MVIHGRGHELDWQRIRTTLGLLEVALGRRDLLSELDRLAAAARAAGEPPRP